MLTFGVCAELCARLGLPRLTYRKQGVAGTRGKPSLPNSNFPIYPTPFHQADVTETTPDVIRTIARRTALKQVDIQRAEFMQLGIMADWHGDRGTYRTLGSSARLLDRDRSRLAVYRSSVRNEPIARVSADGGERCVLVPSSSFSCAFKIFLYPELIYHAHRPVYYSPSSRSALAEAELEYVDDHVSTSVYVAFVLDESTTARHPMLAGYNRVEALVWTTTPWTLSANMVGCVLLLHLFALTFMQGIAVNPQLAYAVLGSPSDPGRAMIVVRDRIQALSDVLGPVIDLGDISGKPEFEMSHVPRRPVL